MSKRIVAMASHERPWSNVELIKDCGLIPYLLYREHDCESVMVGAKGGDYPYLNTYVKGLRMDSLPDGKTETKVKYISENAMNIDALVLRGVFSYNFPVAEAYKRNNPEGRIYLGLVANSIWMDKLDCEDDAFVNFMNSCDVIATSSEKMSDHLNRKWPWVIEHIPNGYYDFDKCDYEYDYACKENTILTVSRLGTSQKRTDILLQAFAMIADAIPDWNLKLIGNVEESFKPYIESFYEYCPQLRTRVIFEGELTDRKALMDEYRRAKIFALSSDVEGGTPNVISEAQHRGLVVATTKIDAYEEAIGYGRCGMASNTGEANEFAQILYDLATSPVLESLSRNAVAFANEHFDMRKYVDMIYELLFG